MTRVETPSRLHFGLLSLPGVSAGPNETAPRAGRHFGSVGLMVKEPGIELTVAPAASWSASGPSCERALAFARVLCEALKIQGAFAIHVVRCPAQHVGLGTGTQLGLAVARAIAVAMGHEKLSAVELAKLIGRGRRSAIGIHGFDQGGFLVESGKRNPEAISPLVARLAFPDDWSILLVTPRALLGDHGQREIQAFKQLERLPAVLALTERLCRLVLMGLLPALAEHDLDGFGEGLYEFNRAVGEMFKPWQGDIYAHPEIARLVAVLRNAGVKGVGQSSWGPTVFGVVPATQGADLTAWFARQRGAEAHEITITSADNEAARTLS